MFMRPAFERVQRVRACFSSAFRDGVAAGFALHLSFDYSNPDTRLRDGRQGATRAIRFPKRLILK
jgi:hypothetical protein